MQSIKNTSVGILLLFLSYGVYQVMMKPVPSRLTENIDGLEIMDAVETLPTDSPTDASESVEFANKTFDLLANPIPPSLLQAPPSEAVGGSRFGLGKFDPPKSQNFDSSVSPAATKTSSSSGFEPVHSSQFASEFNPTGDFDPDSRAMTKPEMASVAPRPANPTGLSAADPSEAMSLTDSLPSNPKLPKSSLTEAWPKINALVEQGLYRQALLELSAFYHADGMAAEDRQRMLNWLDALAAKVIYSSEHHLQSVPYIIQPGDTIASLARQWQIPAQLIYNVNSSKIVDPNELTPGVEIKLVQGPFDAEVQPDSQTLTLFLDSMYAGRFKINANPTIQSGEFGIVDKSAKDQSERPYWIRLSNGASIFESEIVPTGNSEIGLDPGEAEEVFSILSASSKIRILR